MAFAIVFCAVMMMKRVSMRAARACWSTSRPERSGILMSTSATSKGRARSSASAAVPLPTATTLCPCCVQARSRTQRIDSSSSATRMAAADVEAGLEPGREQQLARPPERLEGVLHQVQEDLRQLRAVAPHRGQARVEGAAQRDRPPGRRLALERDDVVQHAMDVERLEAAGVGTGELPQGATHPVTAP